MSRLALLVLACMVSSAIADEPSVLPDTKPLTGNEDFASTMIDGIDRFLLRKTDEVALNREKFWNRDLLNGVDGHVSADEPNRQRLLKILGMRISRRSDIPMDVLSTTRGGPNLCEDETVRVVSVRW